MLCSFVNQHTLFYRCLKLQKMHVLLFLYLFLDVQLLWVNFCLLLDITTGRQRCQGAKLTASVSHIKLYHCPAHWGRTGPPGVCTVYLHL